MNAYVLLAIMMIIRMNFVKNVIIHGRTTFIYFLKATHANHQKLIAYPATILQLTGS